METLSDEEIHEALYRAHWLLSDGNRQIHLAAAALYARGRFGDQREKFATVLAKLEEVRDQGDKALQGASEARSKLIKLTGCDGSCMEPTSRGDEERKG